MSIAGPSKEPAKEETQGVRMSMRLRRPNALLNEEQVQFKQPRACPSKAPSKVAKEEETMEDVKEVVPMTEEAPAATGSVSFHIKGPIQAEHLVHRNMHTCEYCEFTGMTNDRLTAHREQKHRIYLCRFCKKEFDSRFTQHKHYPICEKLLAMRQKVKKQCADIKDRSHTHDCIRCMHVKVKCPICKIVFNNMFDLGDHRQHPCKQYTVRLFACNGCKTQFATANGLKSHLIAKYSERDFKCYNTGTLSYESMKIPKYTKRGAHVNEEHPLEPMQHSVTLRLVPIKDEPTLPEEMHDAKAQHALVASHLLTEFDGTKIAEYYYAMRKMFFRVECPFCGVECKTHAALHSHGLIHHPPHERCLYQCRGCSITYQTPTGLGQHLKREFDDTNATCYNTVGLVRKEDYLGPVTGWNKKPRPAFARKEDYLDPLTGWNKKPRPAFKRPYQPIDADDMFNTIDVKSAFDDDDMVKKEEPDDDFHSYDIPSTRFMDSSLGQSCYMAGDREVKTEPEEEIKPEPFLSH